MRQQFFVQMLTEFASDSSLHLTEFASLCNVAAIGDHSGKEHLVELQEKDALNLSKRILIAEFFWMHI